MKQGTIKKKDLKKLIDAAKKHYRVYGPVKEDAGVSLAELGSGEEVEFNYSNLKMSLKGLFFPQCEAIYGYEGDEHKEADRSDEKMLVLGVRPCDARALLCLDKLFGGDDFKDPYYLPRREGSVIVTMVCSDPAETCFCTSFGGGPASSEGSDVIFFNIDDSLLFEACSDKGEAFIKEYGGVFEKPGSAQLKARDGQTAGAEKKVVSVDVKNMEKKLKKSFDSPAWDSIAQKCLGCSVCTFFCPTCHCFAIFDERSGSGGKRTRNWDACTLPAFTLEASGHNPRSTHGARMKQRVMHKFCYTVENFEDTFCVGCGRCISHCPVNVDIREVIAEVTK